MKYLSVIVILFVQFNSFIYPQDLTLNLSLEKGVYLKGEPVYAIAELTNNSSPIKIQPLQLVYCMDLIFMDSLKTVLRKTAAWPTIGSVKGGVDFNQGDTKYGICFVLSLTANDPDPSTSLFDYRSLKPGKYYLQFHYTYKNPLKIEEKKEYLSDTVEFRVVEPQSEADKLIFNILKTENGKGASEKPYDERKEYAHILMDLAKKYPESGYFPSAYLNFFYSLESKEYWQIDKIIEESLAKHPDAFVNILIAERYWLSRSEVFTSKEFFNKLSSKTKRRLGGYIGRNKEIKELESKLRQQE